MPSDRLSKLARAYHLQRTGQAKRIREQAGITASELSRALNTTPGNVLRWEAGKVRPRPDAALAWLDALDALAAEQGTDQEEKLATASA